MTSSYSDGYAAIRKLQVDKGLSLGDILTEVFKYVGDVDLSPAARMYILRQMSDLEYRLSFAVNDALQLGGLVGSFHKLRAIMQDAESGAAAMDVTA